MTIKNTEKKTVENMNEDNGKFFNWIQTFSKKIVTIFSILYLAVIVSLIIMLMYELRMGFTDGLSTMISEINETFRIVIGGYLIKAALENSFKITGSYFQSINKLKLQAFAKSKKLKLNFVDDDESEEVEEDADSYDDDEPKG